MEKSAQAGALEAHADPASAASGREQRRLVLKLPPSSPV